MSLYEYAAQPFVATQCAAHTPLLSAGVFAACERGNSNFASVLPPGTFPSPRLVKVPRGPHRYSRQTASTATPVPLGELWICAEPSTWNANPDTCRRMARTVSARFTAQRNATCQGALAVCLTSVVSTGTQPAQRSAYDGVGRLRRSVEVAGTRLLKPRVAFAVAERGAAVERKAGPRTCGKMVQHHNCRVRVSDIRSAKQRPLVFAGHISDGGMCVFV